MQRSSPSLLASKRGTMMTLSPGLELSSFLKRKSSVTYHESNLPEKVLQFQRRLLDTKSFVEMVKKTPKKEEEIKIIRQELADINFFKNLSDSLSESHVNSLIKHCNYQFLPRLSTVFKYGDDGYNFYVILKGSVLVLLPRDNYDVQNPASSPNNNDSQPKAEGQEDLMLPEDIKQFLQKRYERFVIAKMLNTGETFGELALISSNSKRNATIVTSRDTHFLLIGKNSYDQVLRNCNNSKLASRIELLKKVSGFESWAFAKILAFLQLLKEKKLHKNDIVFREKDPPDSIYFISSGEIELAILLEAQIFGAEAVLSNSPRDYQAKVVSASAELLILSREAYNYNLQNLKLDTIFSRDASVTEKWRSSWFNKLKRRINAQETKGKLIKMSFDEKIKMNYFEKADHGRKNKALEHQSMEKSEEQKKQVKFSEEGRTHDLKKSQRNLLRIIKSSEYLKCDYSERDQLSLIQMQMNKKYDVFFRKNPEKSHIDLSVDDQRAHLEDLLKKKLMIFNTREKKSPKPQSFSRKIKVFLEKDPSQTETMFTRNLNFRVKKSQSFGSPARERTRNKSLPSFIVKNSLKP